MKELIASHITLTIITLISLLLMITILSVLWRRRGQGLKPSDHQVLIPALGTCIGMGLMAAFSILQDLSLSNVGIGMLIGYLLGYVVNGRLHRKDSGKGDKTRA